MVTVCSISVRANMEPPIYFEQRHDKVDTPELSPLGPFDGFMARQTMDDSAFLASRGGFPTQGENYTFDHNDFSSNFDLLPQGDTMPRAFPGSGAPNLGPTVTTATSPGNPAFDPTGDLFNSRDSSEDCLNTNTHPQTFEVPYSFLPSPPNAEENANGTTITTPAISPKQPALPTLGGDAAGDAAGHASKQRADRKKRRRHSTPVISSTDREKSTPGMPGDEKRRSTTQLRTASRAPKRYSQSTARKPAETPEEVKARAAHNQVEQQYRKRLNAQFERLLSVLPQPDYDEEGMDEEGGGEGGGRVGMEKRISKAEVLDLARRRIKMLEKDRTNLERQVEEMVANERRMNDEWTRMHGGPMPTVKVER